MTNNCPLDPLLVDIYAYLAITLYLFYELSWNRSVFRCEKVKKTLTKHLFYGNYLLGLLIPGSQLITWTL